MNEVVRVGVVGGGPAGLLSSIALAREGVSAEVFEEHSQVGVPRHCTGLLSSETINSIRKITGGLSDDFLIQAFREYVVKVVGRGEGIILKIPGKVYVTDRVLLEKELMNVAVSEGVEVKLKSRVNELSIKGRLRVSSSPDLRRYDLIILSEGAVMNYSTSLRLCGSRSYLRGLQSVVKVRGSIPEHPIVYVGREVSCNFFGWAVPYGEGRVIIGYADRKASLDRLRGLVREYMKDTGCMIGGVVNFFGGLIPLVKPCNPISGKVIGVGDAIASVKPISGGGLYPIVKEVEALHTVVSSSDIKEYVRRINPLLSRLRRQHLLRKGLSVFGGYEGVVKTLRRLGIKELTISDYDLLKFRFRFLPKIKS